MATLIERRPGVWFARVFVPGADDLPGRQAGRVFRGTKKAVRAPMCRSLVVVDELLHRGSEAPISPSRAR